MKKIILSTVLVATGLCADMMTDMAKDAAMSKAKSEVRTTVVKEVAGNDVVKKELASKAADKVLGKEDPIEKMKTDAVSSVVGSGTPSIPDVSSVVGKTKKEASVTDKAVDMAADKAGVTDTMQKDVAKQAIKSIM